MKKKQKRQNSIFSYLIYFLALIHFAVVFRISSYIPLSAVSPWKVSPCKQVTSIFIKTSVYKPEQNENGVQTRRETFHRRRNGRKKKVIKVKRWETSRWNFAFVEYLGVEVGVVKSFEILPLLYPKYWRYVFLVLMKYSYNNDVERCEACWTKCAICT